MAKAASDQVGVSRAGDVNGDMMAIDHRYTLADNNLWGNSGIGHVIRGDERTRRSTSLRFHK